MDYKKQESGLIVPIRAPDPPKRNYGILEIQNEEAREKAIRAMELLWEAMDLSHSGHIHVPPHVSMEQREAYWNLYKYIGETLLGDDMPEYEQMC